MDVITYQKSYREYKAELDSELQKTAEGFVRIGYLLKVARDTNVLAESGYKTVAEFAQAEYSLDKTQVSRLSASMISSRRTGIQTASGHHIRASATRSSH